MTETNKKNILDALRSAGVTFVTVKYSGSGDSGQMDAFVCLNSFDESIDCPTTIVRYIKHSHRYDKENEAYVNAYDQRESSLETAIESFFYDALESLHGGWENDAGGEGEFIIDVASDLVTLEHYQCYEEYTKHTNEI